MARVYATKEQLEAYLEGDTMPAKPGQLLRSASRDVDEMLLTAVYPVDAAGLPSEPTDADAIREATILQALHRGEHGDEIEMAAAGEPVSLGPLSFGSAAAGSTQAVPAFNPEAHRVLRLAGLIPGTVSHA